IERICHLEHSIEEGWQSLEASGMEHAVDARCGTGMRSGWGGNGGRANHFRHLPSFRLWFVPSHFER
ncbi:hypothetical protein, partial [Burkholderia sp. Ac-20384]|uniref:hypothetical protein n=1 Tax=Burkholderia sp. Ac-20384 TaxID=2703902 RepID=UPI00197ED2B9